MKDWLVFGWLIILAALAKAGAVALKETVELIEWAEPGMKDLKDIAVELWGMRGEVVRVAATAKAFAMVLIKM